MILSSVNVMSIDYRELRARLRIEDVLSWMSWRACRQVGDQLRGSCPLCSATADKGQATSNSSSGAGHRTFSVHTQRNLYCCFRCHSSGNALDLWSAYRKLPIYEAAQEIQNRLDSIKQPQNVKNRPLIKQPNRQPNRESG